MGLFDFGKVKRLERENDELKKLAADARGFQNMRLENIKAQIQQNIAVYPTWNMREQVTRFTTNDDLYSVITLIAQTAAKVPLYGYELTKDKKAFHQLQMELKGRRNINRIHTYQTKALTDLPDKDPVAILLEKPNNSMSKYQFYVNVYSFLLLSGEVFILKQRPPDGSNAGKTINLEIMFPECVTLRVSKEQPRRIMGYDYTIDGIKIFENIPAEDVIHVKYFNPEITHSGDQLRGLSPIKVLAKRFARLDSNMDVSVAHLQNSGVPSIVYDKTNAQTKEAAEVTGKRQDNWYRFSGNPANAGMPFFASGEMGVLQLGSHLADMEVAELANVDFKKLCNAYHVSDRLFNNDATGSEISDTNAQKSLYIRAVLPNVELVKDGLSMGLLPDFSDGVSLEGEDGEITRIDGDGKKRVINEDISEITELHEDVAKKMQQFSNLPFMIPNMILTEMGYPPGKDPLMEKVYVRTGYTPIEDLTMEPPLEQITEDGL